MWCVVRSQRDKSHHSYPRAFPEVRKLPAFISPAECRELIRFASPRVKRSTVWKDAQVEDPIRTSSTAYLTQGEHPIMRKIENLASRLSGFPVENIEPLQFLRYQPGQQYKAHYDYFDPIRRDSVAQVSRGGQRACSIFLYLNTLPASAGGETKFPRRGLHFTPEAGCAIMWWNLDKEGRVKPDTYHAGLPPTPPHEKYAINIWIRERKFV